MNEGRSSAPPTGHGNTLIQRQDYFLTSTIAKQVMKAEREQVNRGWSVQEKYPKETGQEGPESRSKAWPNPAYN